MAKIYEQYQKYRAIQEDRALSIESRVDAAMDQTELLKEVRRRVEAFVRSYERVWSFEIEHVKGIREEPGYDPQSRRGQIAESMEIDLQTLRAVPGSSPNLTLDDVKILLDQLPQKDM